MRDTDGAHVVGRGRFESEIVDPDAYNQVAPLLQKPGTRSPRPETKEPEPSPETRSPNADPEISTSERLPPGSDSDGRKRTRFQSSGLSPSQLNVSLSTKCCRVQPAQLNSAMHNQGLDPDFKQEYLNALFHRLPGLPQEYPCGRFWSKREQPHFFGLKAKATIWP